MLGRGVSIVEVAAYVGDSSETIMSTYAHFLRDSQSFAKSALDQALSAASNDQDTSSIGDATGVRQQPSSDCIRARRSVCDGESACKRDSVVTFVTGGHPSLRSTRGCRPADRRAGSPCPLLDLAPDGVYRAVRVAPHAGALLPHRFTLTCDRRDRSRRPIGGLSLLHVRQVTPTWLSPASCPVESRLSSTRSARARRAAATRPTHHRGLQCKCRDKLEPMLSALVRLRHGHHGACRRLRARHAQQSGVGSTVADVISTVVDNLGNNVYQTGLALVIATAAIVAMLNVGVHRLVLVPVGIGAFWAGWLDGTRSPARTTRCSPATSAPPSCGTSPSPATPGS